MEEKNFFTAFGMIPHFDLDREDLDKRYYLWQKQAHPDSGRGQLNNLSAYINKAYTALKDPLIRAKILLQEEGLWPIHQDQEVLSQMMALQEQFHSEKEKLLDFYNRTYKNLSKSFAEKDFKKAQRLYQELLYISSMM